MFCGGLAWVLLWSGLRVFGLCSVRCVLGVVVGACAGVLLVVVGFCCCWRWLLALCGRCLVWRLGPGRGLASCLCGLSFLLFASVCCCRSLVLGALLVAVVVVRGCCGLGLGWGAGWGAGAGRGVVRSCRCCLPCRLGLACVSPGAGVLVLLVCAVCGCCCVGCVCAFFCSVRFGFVAPPALEAACRLVMAVGGVITL